MLEIDEAQTVAEQFVREQAKKRLGELENISVDIRSIQLRQVEYSVVAVASIEGTPLPLEFWSDFDPGWQERWQEASEASMRTHIKCVLRIAAADGKILGLNIMPVVNP